LIFAPFNFAFLFRSRNLRNKRHANITGFTVRWLEMYLVGLITSCCQSDRSSYQRVRRVAVVSVVVRRGAMGTNDSRRLSVPGSRQLGHRQVPRLWQTNAAADLLPGRAVRTLLYCTLLATPLYSWCTTVTQLCPSRLGVAWSTTWKWWTGKCRTLLRYCSNRKNSIQTCIKSTFFLKHHYLFIYYEII